MYLPTLTNQQFAAMMSIHNIGGHKAGGWYFREGGALVAHLQELGVSYHINDEVVIAHLEFGGDFAIKVNGRIMPVRFTGGCHSLRILERQVYLAAVSYLVATSHLEEAAKIQPDQLDVHDISLEDVTCCFALQFQLHLRWISVGIGHKSGGYDTVSLRW